MGPFVIVLVSADRPLHLRLSQEAAREDLRSCSKTPCRSATAAPTFPRVWPRSSIVRWPAIRRPDTRTCGRCAGRSCHSPGDQGTGGPRTSRPKEALRNGTRRGGSPSGVPQRCLCESQLVGWRGPPGFCRSRLQNPSSAYYFRIVGLPVGPGAGITPLSMSFLCTLLRADIPSPASGAGITPLSMSFLGQVGRAFPENGAVRGGYLDIAETSPGGGIASGLDQSFLAEIIRAIEEQMNVEVDADARSPQGYLHLVPLRGWIVPGFDRISVDRWPGGSLILSRPR